MKVAVSCECGEVFDAPDPEALWNWLRAHTTARVEPLPGVRRIVHVHDTHVELNGVKLW